MQMDMGCKAGGEFYRKGSACSELLQAFNGVTPCKFPVTASTPGLRGEPGHLLAQELG